MYQIISKKSDYITNRVYNDHILTILFLNFISIIFQLPSILNTNIKNILVSLFYFFLAGVCEIGGGYLVWLWLRDDLSWILGAAGGFVLFLYGIIPTFQQTHFHRVYAAYGGIFIVMALLWDYIFEKNIPDVFDIIGASVALVGVVIIFYMPRQNSSGKNPIWSNQQ